MARVVERRRPEPARLRDLVPARAGARAAPARRGGRSGSSERRLICRGHIRRGSPSSGWRSRRSKISRRRAQRGGEVEVRAAADEVGDHDLRALALHEVVDAGEVVDVHRLPEVRWPLRSPRSSTITLGSLVGSAVELGQPPGGDRAAEPAADDADVDPLSHSAPSRQVPPPRAAAGEPAPVGEVAVAVRRGARMAHHLEAAACAGVALRWVAAAQKAVKGTAAPASQTTRVGLVEGESAARRRRSGRRSRGRGTSRPAALSAPRARRPTPGPASSKPIRGWLASSSASASTAPGSGSTPAIACGWIGLPSSVRVARRPGMIVSKKACSVASARSGSAAWRAGRRAVAPPAAPR